MQHYAAFHVGLYCLPKYPLRGFQYTKGYTSPLTLYELLGGYDLILYMPVNNFSVMSGRVFLGLASTKQSIKFLAQEYNAVPPVRQDLQTVGWYFSFLLKLKLIILNSVSD